MSQFEYTDLNKFFVSIGVFLIGLAFLMPWLFFRENFDLLIKSNDLKSYTETAQHIIGQRQLLVSYFPITILVISGLSFGSGVFLLFRGIKGWNKAERLEREAKELSNKMATQKLKTIPLPEESSTDIKTTIIEDEEPILNSIEVPINNLWELNHWGSDVASIKNGKMIFSGTRTRLDTEGSHVDLKMF